MNQWALLINIKALWALNIREKYYNVICIIISEMRIVHLAKVHINPRQTKMNACMTKHFWLLSVIPISHEDERILLKLIL